MPASDPPKTPPPAVQVDTAQIAGDTSTTVATPPEFGGREGPEPTRFGDWEKGGRCIDF